MARKKAQPKGDDLATNALVKFNEETNALQENLNRSIEELAVYDELMSGVLEVIRSDIKKGLTAEEIMQKYAHLAAARVTSIALTDLDTKTALAASKDILDRAYGRAKEKKEITHRLDKVDDKQIDAILLTELEALEVDYKDVEDDEQ